MSSSPPERRGGGGEGERGEEAAAPVARAAAGLGRRRSGDPSSSRQRSADEVWPEHFVEAVAAQVAVDATRSAGRLAAAPAVVAVFQVFPSALHLRCVIQAERISFSIILFSSFAAVPY